MWGKWATAANIDSAVAERDVEYLARIIGGEDVPAEVRQHLAKVIRDILTGEIAFPRKRPKKKGLDWEKKRLAEQVWDIKKSKGWKKISSAVEYVAKEKGCSPRTVWKCWAGFDPIRYEIDQEDRLLHYYDLFATKRWQQAARLPLSISLRQRARESLVTRR